MSAANASTAGFPEAPRISAAAGFFSVISHVVRPFLKTPAQGARTFDLLASSPDVEGVSGQFFANSKPKTANKIAYDADMTARLWHISAELVGLTLSIP